MKQYEQNITIELNEKLSFETGQEIEEMISISIDPDIVIQAYKEHIQIRGIILLAGEYHRRRETGGRSHTKYRQSVNRYIEKVVNLDNDIAGFSHRFPVEIAVAKERVENVEDVVVTVDSFDYELPSANTLNIMASLHIHGILPERKTKSGMGVAMASENKTTKTTFEDAKEARKHSTYQKQHDKKVSEDSINVTQDNSNKNEANESATEKTANTKEEIKKAQHLNNEKQRSLKLIKNDTNFNENHETNRMDQVESERNNDEVTGNQDEKTVSSNYASTNKKQKSGSDLAQNDQTSAAQHGENDLHSNQHKLDGTEEDEKLVDGESELTTNATSDEKDQSKTTDTSSHEMQIELSESAGEDEDVVKDVTFLTELFEEEEETYTQVTIYIAQEDDSIESIAKRYEIPVLQLLKDNNLSADTIEAGQLITIRQRSMS